MSAAPKLPDSAFRPLPSVQWIGWVQAYRDGQPVQTRGIAGDNIESALADAFTTATRFAAMGWSARIEHLQEVCARCQGTGLARPDRNHRYLGRRNPHCHKCGGMGSFRRLGTIDVKPDPSAYLTIQ